MSYHHVTYIPTDSDPVTYALADNAKVVTIHTDRAGRPTDRTHPGIQWHLAGPTEGGSTVVQCILPNPSDDALPPRVLVQAASASVAAVRVIVAKILEPAAPHRQYYSPDLAIPAIVQAVRYDRLAANPLSVFAPSPYFPPDAAASPPDSQPKDNDGPYYIAAAVRGAMIQFAVIRPGSVNWTSDIDDATAYDARDIALRDLPSAAYAAASTRTRPQVITEAHAATISRLQGE